jgi:hypothetical protein
MVQIYAFLEFPSELGSWVETKPYLFFSLWFSYDFKVNFIIGEYRILFDTKGRGGPVMWTHLFLENILDCVFRQRFVAAGFPFSVVLFAI